MNITKKKINELTRVERNGFSTWKYTLSIKVDGCDLFIQKDFNYSSIHSIQSDWTEAFGKDEYIGDCDSKKEFVDLVQEWIGSYESKF